MLQILKKDYKIGIVTNTDRVNFVITHHSSKVPQLADFVVAREDYNKGKPEPDAYLAALKIANCQPDQALVIEDSPRGILAAQAAGMRVVTIPNHVIAGVELPDADFCIKKLSELPQVLKKI